MEEKPAFAFEEEEWRGIWEHPEAVRELTLLDPLALPEVIRFPNLTRLHLQCLELVDLRPLANLPKLAFLDLFYSTVRDPSALSGLRHLRGIFCTEGSCLAHMKSLSRLENVTIQFTRLEDLSPLTKLRRLKRLDIQFCRLGEMDTLFDLGPNIRIDLLGSKWEGPGRQILARAELHQQTMLPRCRDSHDGLPMEEMMEEWTRCVDKCLRYALQIGISTVAFVDSHVLRLLPEPICGMAKPIFGMEVCICPTGPHQGHLPRVSLLARSDEGIARLHGAASLFGHHPRLTPAQLAAIRPYVLVGSGLKDGFLYRMFKRGAAPGEMEKAAAECDYLEFSAESPREYILCILALGEALHLPACAVSGRRSRLAGGYVFRDGTNAPCLEEWLEGGPDSPLQMLGTFHWLGREKAWKAVVADPQLLAGWVLKELSSCDTKI